ncbi:MAG: hypothetical protein JJE52_01550 [Acidimicrobiia bacterium]|nr:hypothetical protein [Acidimicrobiia bacterium]
MGCPDEKQSDADLALAYGLAHMGDRELIVVLPEGLELPTRQRIPWIDAPVTVMVHDSDRLIEPSQPLSRGEVLLTYVDPLVTAVHALGERAAWIERLLTWADTCPELVPAHRSSYLAWHCHGRLVLRIAKRGKGMRITGGVASATTPSPHHQVDVVDQMAPAVLHRVTSAASAAIADRLGGIDASHGEHQLQERLAGLHRKLGLTATLREFPAIRPGGARGFIDLLGVGHDGAIHIVETKIGPDPMLALQGLDYWIWATAHRDGLVAHLTDDLNHNLAPSPRIVIDYVLGATPGAPLVSPYTAAQLELIDGSVPWQVHTVADWDGDDTTISSFGRRLVPEWPRATTPRFAARVEADLVGRSGDALHRRVFFAESGAGIIQAARPAFDSLRDAGGLHGFIDHVRSSQAFALNLFGGTTVEEQRGIWRLLGCDQVEPEALALEYVDPHDALRELQPARTHQTQVDVLMRATDPDGQKIVALIEVKLTESGSGTCSAFESPANDRRDVCHNAGPWEHDTAACFQLRNQGGPHRRTYDQFVRPGWVRATGTGCEFRELNQPMATSPWLVRSSTAARPIWPRSPSAPRRGTCTPGANGTG